MKAEFAKISLIIFLAIGAFVLGWNCGHNEPQKEIVVQVDTLVISDTIHVTEPEYITRTRIEKVLVPVTDTIRQSDTLFVAMNKEKVTWHDSLCVVYASGVMTQIDSVWHYERTRVINKTTRIIDKKRWGLGISAGYGASKQGLSPYVGIGLSYHLAEW